MCVFDILQPEVFGNIVDVAKRGVRGVLQPVLDCRSLFYKPVFCRDIDIYIYIHAPRKDHISSLPKKTFKSMMFLFQTVGYVIVPWRIFF